MSNVFVERMEVLPRRLAGAIVRIPIATGVLILLAASGLPASHIEAQGRVTLRTDQRQMLTAEVFTHVSHIRELSDKRVIVADGKERRLLLVDFEAGSGVTVGRQGAGPQEYRSVGRLIPAGRDSAMMFDQATRRWVRITGAPSVDVISANQLGALAGRGALDGDGRGRFLAIVGRATTEQPPLPGAPDSSTLVLISPAAARTDTIAWLEERAVRVQTGAITAEGRPSSLRIQFSPLPARDQALITRDGWIAIARQAPHRIEWISPTRQRTVGPSLAFDNLPLTARERQAVRARFERAGSAKGRPADDAPWPERLPPFLDDALLEAPDGRLVLARTPTAANPGNRYVFIERTGRVGATLELPPTERVVGFGAATVYTVVQDDDGLERLARYRWP